MERTQDGELTEDEVCQFGNALSGQEGRASGVQEMIGKQEAEFRDFLIDNGPAVFARLAFHDEDGGTLGDAAGEEEALENGPELNEMPALEEAAVTDEAMIIDEAAAKSPATQKNRAHTCEWAQQLRRLFFRYDMDGSGKINSQEELEQLAINAIVKCGVPVVNPLPQIEELLNEMDEEQFSRGMDFAEFSCWLHHNWSLLGCPPAVRVWCYDAQEHEESEDEMDMNYEIGRAAAEEVTVAESASDPASDHLRGVLCPSVCAKVLVQWQCLEVARRCIRSWTSWVSRWGVCVDVLAQWEWRVQYELASWCVGRWSAGSRSEHVDK